MATDTASGREGVAPTEPVHVDGESALEEVVDVDENHQLAAAHGVRGVPTLLVFSGGEQVEEVVGAQGEAELRSLLAEYLA